MIRELNIIAAIIFFKACSVHAQVTTSVYGEIIDVKGEPIIGASVFLEGTQLGA